MPASKIYPKSKLELQKSAIQNLAENKMLFKEELIKSINLLSPVDIILLYSWVEENYLISHYEIINEVFYNID